MRLSDMHERLAEHYTRVLRDLVAEKGQTEASRLTGLTQPTISRILGSDRHRMGVDSIDKMAEYCGDVER
jgi:hypothetical protein